MKKIMQILLGIWCAVASFVSPVWLGMIFLNITGRIYQYDYSMDAGTAIIIGLILLGLWVILALLPNVHMLNTLHKIKKTYAFVHSICVVALCVLCLAMCGWDIVGYLVR